MIQDTPFKKIEIEPMLYGDYRISVWDDDNEPLLDKPYFCRGLQSAYLTATTVRDEMFKDLKIYIRVDSDKLIEADELITNLKTL